MKSAEAKINRIIMVRMDIEEDLVTCLEQAVQEHGIKNGVILNGIGAIHFYRGHADQTFEGLKDLNSLSGIIMDGKVHAHFTASFNDQVVAGHALPGGCKINFFGVACIAELDGVSLKHWDKSGTLL